MIQITKFQEEAENLGIDLDENAYMHIQQVYKIDKYDPNSLHINYDMVLKNLEPTLQKDQESGKYRVGWSMPLGIRSQNSRQRVPR